MAHGFIYCITNTNNGLRYVGQSHLEESRFYESYWGSGRVIKRAVKKYGTQIFTKEILQYCDTQESLDEAERQWILQLDTLAPNGYNLAKGGWQVPFFDGEHHTEDAKQKISEASKKDWKVNPNKQNSLAALKKSAESRRGVPRSEEYRQKMQQYFHEKMQDPAFRAAWVEKSREGQRARAAKGWTNQDLTEEQRARKAEAQATFHAHRTEEEKQQWREKISTSHTGREKTEEHKKNLSESRKQWIDNHPEEFAQQIANRKRPDTLPGKAYEIYNIETGDIIDTFRKMKDFRAKYSLGATYIYRRLGTERPFDNKVAEYSGYGLRESRG